MEYRDTSNWNLSVPIFQLIASSLGPEEVDLFADLTNKPMDPYVSWKPDRGALRTDGHIKMDTFKGLCISSILSNWSLSSESCLGQSNSGPDIRLNFGTGQYKNTSDRSDINTNNTRFADILCYPSKPFDGPRYNCGRMENESQAIHRRAKITR